jgi:hypothetical protein
MGQARHERREEGDRKDYRNDSYFLNQFSESRLKQKVH